MKLLLLFLLPLAIANPVEKRIFMENLKTLDASKLTDRLEVFGMALTQQKRVATGLAVILGTNPTEAKSVRLPAPVSLNRLQPLVQFWNVNVLQVTLAP